MATPPVHDGPAEPAERVRRVLGGRYQLGRRVGSGGMATILRGHDLQLDRPVAIKVLHRHLADDPEVRRRFADEARHAASLAHPNVVEVFDQGEADLPYIVMELVEGPTLRQVLAAHGPMEPAQVLAVVEPLCAALHAAHVQGLVHRDVKPENVLVTPGGQPKLADFGIARVMAATSHTAAGSLVGSVHYLAPELVGGVEATPASDQYGVAVVAWELLTGRKPLPADTPVAVALRHASEDVPPASRYAPDVPPALDAVLARATARDPAARFPSTADLAAALRAAVDADPQPVTAVADDGQVRTLILPAADAATLALSARALAGRAQVRADLEARRGADRGRRPEAVGPGRRPAAVAGVVLLVLALLGGGGYLWWDLVVAPVVAVPDVVGLDRAAAEAALRERGLRMEIDGEEHRVGDPAGRVIGQAGRGERVRTGAVVPVVLSLGPRVVAMPDLLGQPYDAVRDVLDANLFRVALERQHSDTVPAGAVMGQLPRPGEPVEQGAEVAVTVSRGVEQVAVPRLVGLTRDVAEAEAAAARLGPVEVVEEHSDEQPVPGVVLRQVPGPGEQVDVRSPVQLVVSKGPLTIPVPELTGLDVDEAVAALEAAGLEAVHRTAPQQTLGPFAVSSVGVVEGQVPDAGEDIRRGEPVEIYYFTPR